MNEYLKQQIAQYEKIIRELNETLVKISGIVEETDPDWMPSERQRYLQEASTVLSHIPEHLRQGGTWRLEE